MEIFLVGGAVRDRLLGRTYTEKDWVVVGGSPAEMESHPAAQTNGFLLAK